MNNIYLDNAATTKVLESSAEIAKNIMTENYANPSSVHGFGFSCEKLLKNARSELLSAMGADSKNYNLYFTCSGTASDNLAILGSARLLTKKGNRILMGDSEHPAVFMCKAELEKLGYEVLLIPNTAGEIDFDFVEKNISTKTVLITHMYVNNETGAEYDIKGLCKIRDALSPNCLVHTDAVQAFLKTKNKIAQCGADLISVSSHKVHSPKGAGALLCKKSVRLSPILLGGGQESGLFSGTEPLHVICAFANSVNVLSKTSLSDYERIERLRQDTIDKLLAAIPSAVINQPKFFSPYILSVSIPNIKSEVMLRFLSERGIYISAGSACSSKHKENRVLKSFGISSKLSDSTLRISFSSFSTEVEADALIEALSDGFSVLAKIK